MDILGGFEASTRFLFPPLVGQSRENAPPVSIVHTRSARLEKRFFFLFDRRLRIFTDPDFDRSTRFFLHTHSLLSPKGSLTNTSVEKIDLRPTFRATTRTIGRPREGLFGLREWSSDPELAVLVASEKDDPFFKPGHVGPVRRRSDDAASDESDASRDERRFSFPPRDSRDSPETKTKTKLSSRKGKRTRLEPGGSSDDEEGLRLLLDAAVGMNGEAEAPTGGEKKDASDADARMTKDSDPSRDDDASFREKTRVQTETETEKEKAAWGDVSLHASAPPSASDAAAAEARRRHLDGVVQTLSARCAELYVLLGPHQIVARELAVLIVALRGGGARYALQEKIVTEQLWELTRALAFPGGLGETPETRAALARVVAASVDEAATVASASIAEAAAMSLGLAAHREQVERRVEAQVEAHANAARILAATTMRTSAEGRGGTAGDNHATAASRLLAGARSAPDGGASASASAYAALAAASAAADTARTTLQPTLSPPP